MAKKDASTEMDTAIREKAVGTPHSNNERVCWAIKTLVAEVLELFPETAVTYDSPDGRNTMLSVSFDTENMEPNDSSTLLDLMELAHADIRVGDVVFDKTYITVSMIPNPRTQDLRDPFRLAETLEILAESDDEGDES